MSNVTFFLLVIDQFSSWKWPWPICFKKTVPIQIRCLLENLKTKFDYTPTCIHTDLVTELSNSEFKDLLLSRGIKLKIIILICSRAKRNFWKKYSHSYRKDACATSSIWTITATLATYTHTTPIKIFHITLTLYHSNPLIAHYFKNYQILIFFML